MQRLNNKSYAQPNLVSNPSFEEFKGNGCSPFYGVSFDSYYDSIPFSGYCWLKNWISISQLPDVWSLHLPYPGGLPNNTTVTKHVYPHSDSTIVGGGGGPLKY